MMLPTRIRGFSDAQGSWNTACTELRSSRLPARLISATSSPSKKTVPSVGSSKPSSTLSVVVLPQPDSPTSPIVLPRSTSKLTSSTAFRMLLLRLKSELPTGNHLRRCRTDMMASELLSTPGADSTP